MLPINEFLLWNNCNNNCKFCWQKKEKVSTVEERLLSIDLVKERIKFLTNSHVLYVGGELFSEQNFYVKEALLDLFDLTFKKMLNLEIDICYINTNLLYDINDILIPILNMAKKNNLIERLHFTTSGDKYGRFSNTESLFYKNIEVIRHTYPSLYFICNLILTNNFCDDILNDNFNLKEYCMKYNIDVNTIPYIKYGKIIQAPPRKKVFDTLLKLDTQYPGYLKRYCNNFILNQPIFLTQYKDQKLIDVTSQKSECNHSVNFKKCYSDSEECFVCDCKKLIKAMEE